MGTRRTVTPSYPCGARLRDGDGVPNRAAARRRAGAATRRMRVRGLLRDRDCLLTTTAGSVARFDGAALEPPTIAATPPFEARVAAATLKVCDTPAARPGTATENDQFAMFGTIALLTA